MSLIKVENLTFSYPGSSDYVFEDVTFSIDSDWKLGFVGRNGKGKTTFLRLLQGEYEYSGKIISNLSFDYFPYEVADKTLITSDILSLIAPNAQSWEIIRELSYLEVDSEVLDRPFNTLSNGEANKVLLAALFLHEGNFLLIDEPTNHLDLHARKIVSQYLNKKKGFILVCHDRTFLDGCVDHILSINRANIEVVAGNYSSWRENFDRQQLFEANQNKKLKKDIKRLKAAAKNSADWSNQKEASKIGAFDKGYVGHKAAKMMKRSKNIEKRQQKAIEKKASLLKNEEVAESLKIMSLTYRNTLLIEYKNVAVSYQNRQVNSPISFEVENGDRLFIQGKNGSGKSSLLKLALNYPIEHTGQVNIGSGLQVSYVPQDPSFLKGSLKDFSRENMIDEALFKAILRKLDFSREQFDKDMADFSFGQKKKVLIGASLCQKAHLYIWDEPLNYIDIYSRIQIEELIKEFSPTMLVVEHDATFLESIATKIVELSD